MATIPADQQQQIVERIRYLIVQQGMSQARFAERMGISAANMSKHLTGRLPVTAGLVNRICLDYNVSRRWLLTGQDLPFAKSEGENLRPTPGAFAPAGVPVYDIDVTAGFGPLERMFTTDRLTGYVNLPGLNNPENERLVKVSGNSMEPAIRNGSYIAIRELQSDTILWGQAYVIVMDNYRMVKILRRHPDPSRLILHSENPAYEDQEVMRSEVRGLYLVDAVINFAIT